MIINLDKHGGVPIYRQVMNQLKEQIMTGHLAEGTQLESVSQMSGRLKVNPMTISKAYAALVAEGLLERRSGIGVFVNKIKAEIRTREKKAMLSDAVKSAVNLALHMDISEEEIRQLLSEQYRLNSRKNSKKRGSHE